MRAHGLSSGAAQVADFAADPLNFVGNVRAKTANELLKGFREVQQRQAELAVPLLALHGTDDHITSYPACPWHTRTGNELGEARLAFSDPPGLDTCMSARAWACPALPGQPGVLHGRFCAFMQGGCANGRCLWRITCLRWHVVSVSQKSLITDLRLDGRIAHQLCALGHAAGGEEAPAGLAEPRRQLGRVPGRLPRALHGRRARCQRQSAPRVVTHSPALFE